MPAASTRKAATSKPKPALREAAAAPAVAHGRIDVALKELGERAESFANVALGDLKSRAGPYVDELKSHAGPVVDDLKSRAAPVVDDLKTRTQPYVNGAAEQFGAAERIVAERVKERPLTALLAVLGVGVLLGLVLGGGRSR